MDTAALDYERSVFGLESRWTDGPGGERIHYHDVGSGPVVVFVHGSGVGVSSAANWSGNIPVLVGFRSLAFDLIGFGHTQPATDCDWGMPAWRDQLIRFVDALGVDRFFLVGNSLGGRICLHAAVDHPDRVLGVVTMGAVGINPPRPQGTPSAQVAARSAAEARAPTRDEVVQAIEKMVRVRDILTEELVEARYRMATAPGAPERFSRVIKARNQTTDAAVLDPEALAGLPMPMLITHGREDGVIPWHSSVELAGIIPNADLHVFSNCGHWAQSERLADFNNLLVNFLEKHR